jgi:hypothetical protein
MASGSTRATAGLSILPETSSIRFGAYLDSAMLARLSDENNVADTVDWIVEGTHSLVAHYRSKGDLLAGSFANRIVPPGAQLVVEHVTVKDDEAVVELRSLPRDIGEKNGHS